MYRNMTARKARMIVNLTLSWWLPTWIGRSRWWHRRYYAAAAYVRGHREKFAGG